MPFPNTLFKTLRYMEGKIGLNPSAGGSAASWVFTANGMYDPSITGTGHQPMGFDQIMGIYNHFRVSTCKITATFVSVDQSDQVVGVKITAGGALITNGQEACEGGNVMFKVLGPAGSSTDQQVIVYNLDIAKFFGSADFKDRDYQGSQVGNPLEQCYPTVFSFPNNSSDSAGCLVTVVLEYGAQFTEPKLLPQS